MRVRARLRMERSAFARTRLPALACVVIVAGFLLVACRTSVAAPNPPAGTYKSAQLHFSVSYPKGWQAASTPADQSSPAVPLTLVITRAGDTAATGSVSSFTLTVFDLRVGAVATPAAQLKQKALAPNSPLRAVTLAGQTAYQDAPAQRPLPGGSNLTISHTDYYLFTASYEYQISVESVSSEHADADLARILQSFTLI
jgi:hypothetical protein